MGPAVACTMLQRWLNALNDSGSRYQTLFVDGRLGNISLSALSAYLHWRGNEGKKVLLRGLNAAQAMRYLEICENKPAQKKFLFGWISNRVVI
jgi:lysozyme family protein